LVTTTSWVGAAKVETRGDTAPDFIRIGMELVVVAEVSIAWCEL
jgi:hypothetical protein